MAEPDLVAACWRAMAEATGGRVPVTIKCRIGIDNQDSEADLSRFVDTLAGAGCRVFIIHARKAWLSGLSPKENRDVPPLDYGRVYRLKAARPGVTIILNGGIGTLDEAEAHLSHVDGVMLGRAAYQHPLLLREVDRRLFGGAQPAPAASVILDRMMPYIREELARGTRLSSILRHMTGLVDGLPGARAWRRTLAEDSVKPGAGLDLVVRLRELARAAEIRIMAAA
jgi:tRNA-dihydrouridine synthase A